MPSATPSRKTVGWGARIAFGVGSFAEGIKSGSFNYFLLFYYNQALGLPGSWSGLALGLAVAVDAVTDPVAGALSDRHRSRWGRRHPFMYGAALPFAAVFYALFAPPAGLDQEALFAWLVVFSTLTRVALTFYSVPHMTLLAEMSPDYAERTSLASVRMFFVVAGSISALAGGFLLFFQPSDGFENGQLDPAAYPPFAFWAALAMFGTILWSGIGTHRLIPRLPQPSERSGRFRPISVLRDFKDALRLRPFRFMLGSMVADATITGVILALAVYMLTFFWKFDATEITLLLVSGMGGIFLGPLLATPFAGWVGDKKRAAMAGMAWFAFFSTVMVNLRLLGLGPGDEDPSLLPLVFTGSLIGGLGSGVANVLKYSMIADVTDEHERLYHERKEGIYYSSVSFAFKAVSGLGTLVAGLAIDAIGLVPGSDPANVEPVVVHSLGLVYGPFALLLTALPIALLGFYDIDARRHAAIRAELEARAESGA